MTSVSLAASNSVTSSVRGRFGRPIEGDFFYNGFRGGANFTLNEAFTPCPDCPTELTTRQAQRDDLDQYRRVPGEFHFAIRAWKSKVPAVFGCGGRRLLRRICRVLRSGTCNWLTSLSILAVGRSHADLAFDALAGADYFFSPNFGGLLSINTSIIRAPKSTLGKIALWVNSWWVRVSDSFSTNASDLFTG